MKRSPSTPRKRERRTEKPPVPTQSILSEIERQRSLLEIRNEELTKAHADLEISHQRFSDLYEQAPLGYLTFDGNGCIREINAAAANLLGVSRARVIGRPFAAHVEEADRKRLSEHLGNVRRTESSGATDLRLLARDGTVRQVQMTTGRHRDERGRSEWFLSAIEDVTALRIASVSAAYLASIVESSQDIIISYSLDGVIRSWNRAAQKLLGYGPGEIIGRHASAIVPEERRAEFERYILMVKGGGMVTPHETVRMHKDGTPVAVELTLSPVLEGRRVVSVTAIGRDISERKRTESKMRESEERFRALVTASSDVLYRMSPDWREMRQISGGGFLADTAASSRTWLQDYIHPDDQAQVMAAVRLAVRTKGIFELEHRVRRADGSLGWTFSRAVPLKNEDGEIVEWFGAATDTTHRKEVEQALRESEGRFRAILENSLDAAYRRNIQTDRCDYVSPVIERITGYTAGEMASMPMSGVFRHMHPADVRHVRRTIKKAMETGEPCRQLEYRFHCRDGSYRWVAEAFRIISDASGRPLHVVGIVRDVSEHKRMEEELRVSQRLARSTVEAIPAQIAVIDATGGIIDTNKAWRNFARENGGSDVTTGRGANYLEVCEKVRGFDRKDAARFAAGIRAVAAGRKRVFSMEYACHSRVEKRWFTGYVTRFAGRGETQMVVAHVNITAVKLAEEKFRAVLESAPDAMVIVDQSGRIRMVNRQTGRLFGYAPEGLIGRRVEMLMPAKHRQRNMVERKGYSAAPASPPMGIAGMELSGRRKDGSEFPVEISLSPLETGSDSLVCSVVRDITERKTAENEIRKLNAELEERVAGRTAALLTSTASLLRSADALQKANEERRQLQDEVIQISEAEQRRIAQDLHDDLGQQLAGIWCLSLAMQKNLQAQASPETAAAGRIADYLSTSLALTRGLARGLHPVESDPKGLVAALRALAERSSELFKAKCRLVVRRLVRIHDPAMATHLYRIAQEAVSNACRHGRAKHVSIALSYVRGRLALSVSDDGKGMKPGGKHTGMGMRIMNYRAVVLGGSLDFRSPPGGGTTVTCTISTTAASVAQPPR